MRERMEISKNSIQKGAEAEEAAVRFYEDEGYEVLVRNYRLPYGELDLVVTDGVEVVVVEVKGRKEFREWEADHALWREKKRKLLRVTEIYLDRHEHLLPLVYAVRLDIVYVTQGRVQEVFEGEPFV